MGTVAQTKVKYFFIPFLSYIHAYIFLTRNVHNFSLFYRFHVLLKINYCFNIITNTSTIKHEKFVNIDL